MSFAQSREQVFFKIALGMSLSGISLLGFVIPGTVKHTPDVFQYTFAVISGILLAIVTYLAPLHILNNHSSSPAIFLQLHSAMFACMSGLDNILQCSPIFTWATLKSKFEKILLQHRHYLSSRSDGCDHNRRNKQSTNVNFVQLRTTDYEMEDEIEQSPSHEEDIELYDTTKSAADSCPSSAVYSPYFLVFVGSLLQFLIGVYIGSKGHIEPREVITLHVYNAFTAFTIASFLISKVYSLYYMKWFLLLFAVSPLIGSMLYLSPEFLVRMNFEELLITLSTLFCGACFYIEVSFMLPIALHDTDAIEKLKKTLLLLIAFLVVSYGGQSDG